MKNAKEIVVNKRYLTDLITRKIIYFTVSILISQGRLFGTSFPFGVTFLSSVSYKDNIIIVFFGAIIGYLASLKLHIGMKYISSSVLVCMLKFLLSDFKKIRNHVLFSPIITFVSLFSTNIAVNISSNFGRYDFFLAFLESIIASVITHFIEQTLKIIKYRENLYNINLKEFVYIIISLSVLLLPISSVCVFRISLGQVLSILLILSISYVSGVTGGTIAGTIFGVIFNLNNLNLNYIAGSYAISGLVSGMFNYMGKLGMCIVFVFTSVIMSITCTNITDTVIFVYEIIISVIIFLLIPKEFLEKIRSLLSNITMQNKSNNLEHKIKLLFSKYNININNINLTKNKFNRIFIKIEINKNSKKYITKKLLNNISKICNRNFDINNIFTETENNVCKIYLQEVKKFNIEYFVTQHACNNNNFCGDSYKSFEDLNGNFNIIISDGMGTGANAMKESALSSELMKKLLENNINYKSSIEFINQIMLLNSKNQNNESLATLDIFSIDLYTGNANFVKSGAPASYIIRDNKIKKISSNSLPIGIFDKISYSTENIKLSSGDYIIMLSDGVTDLGEEFVYKLLENIFNQNSNNNLKNISNLILNSTIYAREKIHEHDDDISVFVGKIF